MDTGPHRADLWAALHRTSLPGVLVNSRSPAPRKWVGRAVSLGTRARSPTWAEERSSWLAARIEQRVCVPQFKAQREITLIQRGLVGCVSPWHFC